MAWTVELGGEQAKLEVWTEKDGLLARAAHDLCIRASAGRIRLSEGEDEAYALEVEVPVGALRVQGQVKRGQVKPLSPKDQREIEKNLQSAAVLDAAAHPTIRYQGTVTPEGTRARITGELELRGRARALPLSSTWSLEAGALSAAGEVTVRQSEWGITPFSALLGAIKLKDPLRIRWSLRFPAG